MSFQFVLIPAVEAEPIVAKTASKKGGLTDDALSKHAKRYFAEQSGAGSRQRSALLETASPAEKKKIADMIRKQYSSSNGGGTSQQVMAMSDDQICDLLKIQEDQQQSGTCEITCLTIPTPLNGHTAVSMYGDDHGRIRKAPFNQRATNLLLACGHAVPEGKGKDGLPNGMYGDVFVGRAIDDEGKDVWERVDLTPDEVQGDLQKMPWCKIARRKGGGGGQGGAAASLSRTLSNFNQQQQQQQGSGNSSSAGAVAAATEPPQQPTTKAYTWTQTEDEVELRFVVPAGTKSKDVEVRFQRQSLRVSLRSGAKVLCAGSTWDSIDVDGSTFTLQTESSGQRELCVSLEKQTPGQTWNYALDEDESS